MRNPLDDVSLTDGTSFMVAEEPYKRHLKQAVESKQVRYSWGHIYALRPKNMLTSSICCCSDPLVIIIER